jgi:excisionase family DNA binding protein
MRIEIISNQEYKELYTKLEVLEYKIDHLSTEGGVTKKKVLSIKETCELLQASTRTLQRYRDEGKIKFSQVNGKIFFRESDIEDFLSANEVNTLKTGKHGR